VKAQMCLELVVVESENYGGPGLRKFEVENFKATILREQELYFSVFVTCRHSNCLIHSLLESSFRNTLP
jgi:hypothetical protein